MTALAMLSLLPRWVMDPVAISQPLACALARSRLVPIAELASGQVNSIVISSIPADALTLSR
jgi:hypothetical protein